jgi:cytochrome c oxidase assembly protein subunit 15
MPPTDGVGTSSRFARFAWGVLAYNLAVVLWGVYARATGSGAGCGKSWPLCNGEAIPQSPAHDRLIEFTNLIAQCGHIGSP